MTEKKEQLVQTAQVAKKDDELRLLPFAFAGLICFTIAVLLGAGSWIFFGSRNRQKVDTTAETNFPSISVEKPETPANTEVLPLPPVAETNTNPETAPKPAPENVVKVSGGEIAIGGGDTQKPIERVIVKDFSIAETEVTNQQYFEFIKETNYTAPIGWKGGQFPKATENFPVTNVSWQDAVAFCKWMEKKIGLPVRLPTEAEWEFAARGTEAYKYPWGNEWKKDAVNSEETGSKVSAVKSFSINRSPFGAYDMAGNVWEWTQSKVGQNDAVKDVRVKEALKNGQGLRVVKGGSALEKSTQISAQSRYEIPEGTKDAWVGFRYIVEQK